MGPDAPGSGGKTSESCYFHKNTAETQKNTKIFLV